MTRKARIVVREAYRRDVPEIEEVIASMRLKVRSIIFFTRQWCQRHDHLEHPLRRKYSSYEGDMYYTDLRRHWALYRHAMKEKGIIKP